MLPIMKTDETNLPRDPAKVSEPLSVGRTQGAVSAHTRAPSEREQDALDAWRETLGDDRVPPDPVEVHGFDLDAAEPDTRTVIESFSADLARLHKALEAAEARLDRAENARRHDPATGLLRRDALISETWHLEALDRREGAESTVAVLRIEGVTRLHETAGWAKAEYAMEAIGRVLAGAVSAAEPAGRIHDSAFAVLLTGLSGEAALTRAAEIARRLADATDTDPALSALRPGRVSVGHTPLHGREEPYDALDRALRDASAE